MGTKNYREKNYAAASGSWERLRTLKDVPPKFQELQTSANNNLGYLFYMGLGVDTNTKLALQYWKVAYDAGHDESGYHLCHAYGDADRAEYSPRLALGYCKEALRRYQRAADPEEVDAEVVKQIRKYVSRLEMR